MPSRTITHAGEGPVTMLLDIVAGPIEVRVEDGLARATVTLRAVAENDAVAGNLIDDAAASSSGAAFAVRVPSAQPQGGGTVAFSAGGVQSVVTGRVTGPVVQAHTITGGISFSGGGPVSIGGQATPGTAAATGGVVAVTIALPPHSTLTVTTVAASLRTIGHLDRVRYRGSGDAVVEVDSTSELDVETDSGAIRAGRAASVDVSTSSGDIRVGATSSADLRSTGGALTITELAGRARLRSVTGRIVVHAVADSTVRANAVGGDIEISAAPGVRVAADASSVGGRVRTPR